MPDFEANILLVDDDEPSRYVKCRVLRRIGWNVIEAGDGATALELLAERPFDLVVLDVNLPDMNGIEVCRRIKERSPDVMVLQTSATCVGWEDRVLGFEQGADGYLVEPAQEAELVAQVRALLRIKVAERRQANAEALLAHALEASSLGAWEWDVSDNRVIASRAVRKLLDLSSEPLIGEQSWLTTVLPEDRPILEAALSEAIAKREMLEVEFRVRRADGQIRWLSARGRTVTSAVRLRMIGVVLDITERKLAEEQAARLAAIVAQSPEAIISYDLSHRIQSWNSGAEALFGFSAEEAIGMTAQETIVSPEYFEESRRIHEQVLAGNPQSVETRRRRKDGKLIDVALTAAHIRDRRGRIVGKLAIVRDITEKKRAERALIAAQQRMRAVLESVPVGICFSDDPSCERVTGNTTLLRQFELEPGTPLSLSSADRISNPIRVICGNRELSMSEMPLMRAVVENRVIEPMELEIQLPSGRHWFCEVSAAPVTGPSGEVIGGVAVTVDITERKRTEQHINLLIAETNHRAKNLLSVVQGIARLTAPASDPVVFAERLSQRLRALAINQDLLVQTNWQGIEFEDLVRSQLEPFQGLVSSRCTISGPHLRVSASAAQAIGMALHELATNAAKYGALSGPQGRLEVKWDIDTAGPRPMFHIKWREFGGPVVEPPSRAGFGHTVIVRFVQQALGADVKLNYNPAGVEWEVTAAAEQVIERGSNLRPKALAGAADTSRDTWPHEYQ